MKLYKPNPRGTGSACSFSVTSSGKSKGIYVEIIKQKGWDDKTKTGSFDSTKENKLNLKFTPTEMAEMLIVCQTKKGAAKFFHNTGTITSQISFGTYCRKDSDVVAGISLSATKGEKKASVPLTFAEAHLLGEWIRFALHRIFTAEHTEEKKLLQNIPETKIS